MSNNSRNISQVYRGWLHSLDTRSAVDLKRYSNISEVYRSWLHSLGTRSAVEFLKGFTTSSYASKSSSFPHSNLCLTFKSVRKITDGQLNVCVLHSNLKLQLYFSCHLHLLNLAQLWSIILSEHQLLPYNLTSLLRYCSFGFKSKQ